MDGWTLAGIYIKSCMNLPLMLDSINKTSSAELSEAINSMFRWYRDSNLCVVYMADVDQGGSNIFEEQIFCESRYWKRGWTLQELIAPDRAMIFYDHHCINIGNKSDLMNLISNTTGIPEEVLRNSDAMYDCSVAQRLSWQSMRSTTRTEDIAYSLMGLFNVNMPLLYGEGEKAFVRLQEEILKDSSDQSIFAWEDAEEFSTEELFQKRKTLKLRGVLATHPTYFRHSSSFRANAMGPTEDLINREIASTNLGLRMTLPIFNCGWFIAAELAVTMKGARRVEPLGFDVSWDRPEINICIVLWPEPGEKGRLMRVSPAHLFLKSQISTAIRESYKARPQFLLKSNWTHREFVRRQLVVDLDATSKDFIQIAGCTYMPLPIRQPCLFNASGLDRVWSFWEPSTASNTVLLFELVVTSQKSSMIGKWKTSRPPARQHFTLVVFVHPHTGGLCALIPLIEDKHEQTVLDLIRRRIGAQDFLHLTSQIRLSIACQQPGIGQPVRVTMRRKDGID